MSATFTQTSTRLADYTAPLAPPLSPLKPRLCAEEERLRIRRAEAAELCSKIPASDLAAQEAALGLPSMIPEKQNNLCKPPNVKRPRGKENVEPPSHVLSSDGRKRKRGPHRVGVDAPWYPDALTPAYVREAHIAHAQKWFREANEVPNPLAGPTTPDLEAGESEEDEEGRPGLRAIRREDRRKPFPVGAAAGEEVILLGGNPMPSRSAVFHSTRPERPVGAFDPAERLFYAQQQRRRWVRDAVKLGVPWKAAVAAVERIAPNGKDWEDMEEEAEAAEMVLRVYGKLPMGDKKSGDTGKGGKKGKGAKGRKGKKGENEKRAQEKPAAVKGERSVPATGSGEESGPQTSSSATPCSASTGNTPNSASARLTPDSGISIAAGRTRRTYTPSAKARENNPSPSSRGSKRAQEAASEDSPPSPPAKRQRTRRTC